MLFRILLFWGFYGVTFTILPIFLVWTSGHHPAFNSMSNQNLFQVLGGLILILGGITPFYIDFKVVKIPRIRGLFVFTLRIMPLLFIFTHIYVYSRYGLNFRHNTRISHMGLAGYLYALEQLMVVPYAIFLIRLFTQGNYVKSVATKTIMVTYGSVLVALPFNVFNFFSGSVILIALLTPRILKIKVDILKIIAFVIFFSIVIVQITLYIKGPMTNSNAVTMYLQYRISTWYSAAGILFDVEWVARVSEFSRMFFDEKSINTANAQMLFATKGANLRVGSGPGVLGSSLYLLPVPFNFLLVALYGFFVGYLIKCSDILKSNSIMILASMCILFYPIMASPIAFISLELFPVASLFLTIFMLTVRIPKQTAV